MTALKDLAARRPELFPKAELDRLTADTRFQKYVDDLTRREAEAVRSGHMKLLPAAQLSKT